jgi:hypothetical protein
MKWRIFIAAALAVGLTLWTAGAPPAALAFGIALAALLNYKKAKSGTARPSKAEIADPSTKRTVNP